MSHMEAVEMDIKTTFPLSCDNGAQATHVKVKAIKAHASMWKAAYQKYGGDFSCMLMDMLRLWYWWMTTTDTHSIYMVPHQNTWKVKESMEHAQGQSVGLHF